MDAVVVSSQHDEDVTHKQIQEAHHARKSSRRRFPAECIDSKTKFYINPTGRFVVGGPMGDCGLTGRKIIVDTYGGHGAHGGGAFSGKDPSKVDRSACYMARYVAKNIVAAGLADRCLVQLAYAIGVAEPVSVMVNAFGTEKTDEQRLQKAAREIFNFKPAGIIQTRTSRRPIPTGKNGDRATRRPFSGTTKRACSAISRPTWRETATSGSAARCANSSPSSAGSPAPPFSARS